jgi:hypothetical protein
MSLFVKAECGCIALSEKLGDEHVVVYFCDADDEFGMYTRGLRGDTFKPLTADETKDLIGKLAGLIGQGYELQNLTRSLKWLLR